MICVVFTFISGLVILQTSHGKVAEAQAPTIMQCLGSDLTLNEPNPNMTNPHVLRGDEFLASETAAAMGHFRKRLIVASDGRVTLKNLSADDFGVYRVVVELSDDRRIQRSVRLVVSEPPQTGNGMLAVNKIFSSGSSSVRLTCGNFTLLGFPPVSAVWKDPLGRVLPSNGFKDQTFYLDLSLDTAEPGDYCCRLDCPAPTCCCLEERSPLRQCAQVHLQTRKAGATVKITDYVSLASFSQLQQQVLDVAGAVRLLQESERQDCSQSGVAAMAQLIQRQARCDQLDGYVSRVEALEARLTEFSVASKTSALKGICRMRKGYSWYGGRCLKLDTRAVDFRSANASCLADGAQMLNIKSGEDAKPLRDAATAAVTVPALSTRVFLRFWVGATDIATEGTFVWGDGTAFPKLSPLWYPGEPNDVNGQEDCVEVYLNTTSMSMNDTLALHSFATFVSTTRLAVLVSKHL